MRLRRRSLACILVYLMSIGFFPELRALAACPNAPVNEATVTQMGIQDNCGDTTWELRAAFAGFLWDEGPLDGAGTCTGGYIKCDCTNVPLGFKKPTISFTAVLVYADQNTNEYQWWWDLNFYLGQQLNANCQSGSCQANGYSSETDPTSQLGNQGWDDEQGTCNF